MARRGKVDDFVWVLGIALVLIVAAGLFSYFVPYTGPLTNVTVSSFSPGEIGYAQDYVSRTIDLRTFNVGEEQTELLKAWPQLELSTSIIGGNSEVANIIVPDYHLDTARAVRITFDLYQTNNYGNLIVKWNGMEVLNRGVSPGSHEVTIDRDDVRESNTLEIYSTGPGFYFWASSVYIIKNLNVNLGYGPQRVIPFEVLSGEMEMFDRIELSCYASGTGTLVIKVNGAEVYSGSPQGVFTEEFDLYDAPVRAGQNILSLTDDTGTYNLKDTTFKIYTTGERSTSSHAFNLSSENYNFLVQGIFSGKVDYMIDGISRQGSIDIRLNGYALNAPVPEVGWNTAYFTPEMVSAGSNEIEFSGTGSFHVSQAVVGLER